MASGERYKGHDQILEALPRVPGARLVVAGDGDDRPRLEARAADLGCEERVTFTGFVSEATLAELYRRAAVFVMPSLGEGFGLVYLEAMRAGKPCVAARGSAADEVVADGETGFLVDRDDPEELASVLDRLLASPDLARRMGEAGRRRWREQFSLEQLPGGPAAAARRCWRGEGLMCGINGILRLRPDAPADRPGRAAAHARRHDLAGSRRGRGVDLSRRARRPGQPAPGDPRSLARRERSRCPRRTGAGTWCSTARSTTSARCAGSWRSRGPSSARRATPRSSSRSWPAREPRRSPGCAACSAWRSGTTPEKRLLLARDPLGIKPLYYSTDGGCLRFASQVKALEAGGAVSRAVDPAGLAGFLLWGAVPEPFTIRSAVRALPAGCFLTVEDGRIGEPERFYRLDEVPAGEPLAARRPRWRTRWRPTWSRTCRWPSSSRRGSTRG